MKPYPEYKPSGVAWLGDVPGHWEVLRVKEVCKVIPSNVDKLSVEGEQPVSLCNYVDVYKNDRITSAIEFMQATATQEQIKRLGLSVGDVVVTKDSESPWDIAVPTVIAEDIESLVCGYHLSKLAPNRVEGHFLTWALRAYHVNLHFALSAGGITRYGLSSSGLADGNVPVPPRNEQQAIADYLDTETARIDALIQEKLGLIGLLGERRAGVFEALLSEVAMAAGGRPNLRFPWLAVLPTAWSCLKVKHVVQSLDQGISPQCEARVPDEDEWGVLKVGCVNSGVFNAKESKALPPEIDPIQEITVHEGDVLVSRANTKHLVGRAAMADKAYPKLMLSDKLYRLKLNTDFCLPAFLVGFLTLPAIRVRIEERATGASASMLNIDRRTIMDLDMPLPPIARQLEIVATAKAESVEVGALLAHVASEIALLKELRAATIADAVLGRVDVRTG